MFMQWLFTRVRSTCNWDVSVLYIQSPCVYVYCARAHICDVCMHVRALYLVHAFTNLKFL